MNTAAPTRVLAIAGALMAIGIVVGALATHALQTVLTAAQLVSLRTAVDYQLSNALGLLLIGVLLRMRDVPDLRRVAVLLIAGIVCFSGGIYLMLGGAPRAVGFVTPLGGLLLIAGWLWFVVAVLRKRV